MGFIGDAIQQIDSEDLTVGASWVCRFYNYRSSGTASELEPSLLSCFKDESDALRVFNKEMTANAKAIKEDGGLFFFVGLIRCIRRLIRYRVRLYRRVRLWVFR